MEEVRRAEEEIRKVCEERAAAWTVFPADPRLRPRARPQRDHDRDGGAALRSLSDRLAGAGRPPADPRRRRRAGDDRRPRARPAPGTGSSTLPGGETLTYREMVRAVFRSLGRRPILVYLPLGLARFAFRAWRAATGAEYSAASLERMNASLTLDPGPVREVLGITCRPFRPEFPASPEPGESSRKAADENGG